MIGHEHAWPEIATTAFSNLCHLPYPAREIGLPSPVQDLGRSNRIGADKNFPNPTPGLPPRSLTASRRPSCPWVTGRFSSTASSNAGSVIMERHGNEEKIINTENQRTRKAAMVAASVEAALTAAAEGVRDSTRRSEHAAPCAASARRPQRSRQPTLNVAASMGASRASVKASTAAEEAGQSTNAGTPAVSPSAVVHDATSTGAAAQVNTRSAGGVHGTLPGAGFSGCTVLHPERSVAGATSAAMREEKVGRRQVSLSRAIPPGARSYFRLFSTVALLWACIVLNTYSGLRYSLKLQWSGRPVRAFPPSGVQEMHMNTCTLCMDTPAYMSVCMCPSPRAKRRKHIWHSIPTLVNPYRPAWHTANWLAQHLRMSWMVSGPAGDHD